MISYYCQQRLCDNLLFIEMNFDELIICYSFLWKNPSLKLFVLGVRIRQAHIASFPFFIFQLSMNSEVEAKFYDLFLVFKGFASLIFLQLSRKQITLIICYFVNWAIFTFSAYPLQLINSYYPQFALHLLINYYCYFVHTFYQTLKTVA